MFWFSIYGVLLQVSLIILHHGCHGEALDGDNCSDMAERESVTCVAMYGIPIAQVDIAS